MTPQTLSIIYFFIFSVVSSRPFWITITEICARAVQSYSIFTIIENIYRKCVVSRYGVIIIIRRNSNKTNGASISFCTKQVIYLIVTKFTTDSLNEAVDPEEPTFFNECMILTTQMELR